MNQHSVNSFPAPKADFVLNRKMLSKKKKKKMYCSPKEKEPIATKFIESDFSG